jgi:hypothetical protein
MLLLRDHPAHLDDQVADVFHAVAGRQPGEDTPRDLLLPRRLRRL